MVDEKKKKPIIAVGVVLVAVLIGTLIFNSLKKLNSYEVGLKYDTVWKKMASEPTNQGLHPGPPGYKFVVFPSVFKTLEFNTTVCLNRDGVPINLDVSYQYKARAQHLREIIDLFRDHAKYIQVLQAAGIASIHEACSLFNTSQFQAERGKFQETVGQTLAARNDPLYCDVSEIQVSNIERPGNYESAIKQKEAARENIKVTQNERPRLITIAETEKKQAETQANITIAKAQSQGRIKLALANATASAILKEYETEALTYEKLISSDQGLGLSSEAFVSYMGIRTISNAKNPVYIGMKSPAKTSYVKNP